MHALQNSAIIGADDRTKYLYFNGNSSGKDDVIKSLRDSVGYCSSKNLLIKPERQIKLSIKPLGLMKQFTVFAFCYNI